MSQSLTSAESRALKLLGDGINPSMVASAVGLSDSRISQLLSDEQFAARVTELRYESLVAHNQRDLSYDEIEDQLIAKLRDILPFMMKPMEILKSIQVINAAKRRGASAPDSLTQKQEVVQLVMPIQVITQFALNSNGQVVKAGQQDLVTVQSSKLTDLVKTARQGVPNGPISLPAPSS
jgi:hypothetical protein